MKLSEQEEGGGAVSMELATACRGCGKSTNLHIFAADQDPMPMCKPCSQHGYTDRCSKCFREIKVSWSDVGGGATDRYSRVCIECQWTRDAQVFERALDVGKKSRN